MGIEIILGCDHLAAAFIPPPGRRGEPTLDNPLPRDGGQGSAARLSGGELVWERYNGFYEAAKFVSGWLLAALTRGEEFSNPGPGVTGILNPVLGIGDWKRAMRQWAFDPEGDL